VVQIPPPQPKKNRLFVGTGGFVLSPVVEIINTRRMAIKFIFSKPKPH
jgi:hypothetical protein